MIGKVIGVAGLAVVGALWAAPAHADAAGTTDAQCTGSSCSVSVTYTGSAAPRGGGTGSYVSSVPPLCYYSSPRSPKEMHEWLQSQYNTGYYSGQSGLSLFGALKEYENAAKDKSLRDAKWHTLNCPSIDMQDPRAISFAGETAMTMGSDDPFARFARLFRPGNPVPPPLVDPETLRDAAYESMDIPEPTINRNPEIAGSAATLVNLDTFFWADAYRDTWDITASVGPISATVMAKSGGWSLTSPAGGQTCTQDQFTTPYSRGLGAGAGCAISFERASVGYEGGFPVRATATWDTSWTGTPAPTAPQALAPVTTGATVNVPVAESQAVVRSIG